MHLPFETLTQFTALGLTLIGGWFLGLASASGGRKWRELYYEEERTAYGYRDQASSDLRENARRIRDLEAENAKLRAATPAAAHDDHHDSHDHGGHSTAAVAGAAIAGAAAGAVATHAAEHHDDHGHAEPVATAHAEPAHAAPAHDDHGHGHDDHAHDSHGDHHAPADTHHH